MTKFTALNWPKEARCYKSPSGKFLLTSFSILKPEKTIPGMYPLNPITSTKEDSVSWMYPRHTFPWVRQLTQLSAFLTDYFWLIQKLFWLFRPGVYDKRWHQVRSHLGFFWTPRIFQLIDLWANASSVVGSLFNILGRGVQSITRWLQEEKLLCTLM